MVAVPVARKRPCFRLLNFLMVRTPKMSKLKHSLGILVSNLTLRTDILLVLLLFHLLLSSFSHCYYRQFRQVTRAEPEIPSGSTGDFSSYLSSLRNASCRSKSGSFEASMESTEGYWLDPQVMGNLW